MRRRPGAGCDLSDRVVTYLHGGDELDHVLEKFGDYVSSEPLSESLERVDSLPVELPSKEIRLGKGKVEFAVEKVR